MAKKKSERRPHWEVRVMDGKKIMCALTYGYKWIGESDPIAGVVPSYGRGRTGLRVALKRKGPAPVVAIGGERFDGKPDNSRWDMEGPRPPRKPVHIRFPDFTVRADKLAPVFRELVKNGVTEIQYSNLRRLLRK